MSRKWILTQEKPANCSYKTEDRLFYTGYYNLSQSVKETEHPNNLSQDLNVICDDGFHRIILRL